MRRPFWCSFPRHDGVLDSNTGALWPKGQNKGAGQSCKGTGRLSQDLVAGSRVIVSWKEEVLEGKPPRQPYISMIASGSWSADKIAAGLGEVILSNVPARQNENDIILFKSVGMPAWEFAATTWVYRWALHHKAGTSFSLAEAGRRGDRLVVDWKLC